MTKVEIKASGHLGEFSREYFIPPGREFSATADIFRDFFAFVRQGYMKNWDKLFEALAELDKIEKQALKK